MYHLHLFFEKHWSSPGLNSSLLRSLKIAADNISTPNLSCHILVLAGAFTLERDAVIKRYSAIGIAERP
jgi:hypothetical protein